METDNVLKAHTKLLMFVFNKYASGNIQPGQRIRMDVQEFGELIQESGMMNDELNE
jgi:hypothetical protein